MENYFKDKKNWQFEYENKNEMKERKKKICEMNYRIKINGYCIFLVLFNIYRIRETRITL